jgi:hypothetical protein
MARDDSELRTQNSELLMGVDCLPILNKILNKGLKSGGEGETSWKIGY